MSTTIEDTLKKLEIAIGVMSVKMESMEKTMKSVDARMGNMEKVYATRSYVDLRLENIQKDISPLTKGVATITTELLRWFAGAIILIVIGSKVIN